MGDERTCASVRALHSQPTRAAFVICQLNTPMGLPHWQIAVIMRVMNPVSGKVHAFERCTCATTFVEAADEGDGVFCCDCREAGRDDGA